MAQFFSDHLHFFGKSLVFVGLTDGGESVFTEVRANEAGAHEEFGDFLDVLDQFLSESIEILYFFALLGVDTFKSLL